MQDKIFRVLLILSAVVIPIIGGGIVYSLTADASGAFEHFGFWNFIFSDDWVTTAGKESYGALPFITGTLLTTILALLMCIPFSLPVALFTGEYFRGKKIAAVLGTVTDLLAGIPSIIYGLWGFYVLRNVFMHLNLSPQGSGILTAAFVLAIMIVASDGIMIRVALENVGIYGRNTQGVRLINLNGDAKVTRMTLVDHEEPEAESEENTEE